MAKVVVIGSNRGIGLELTRACAGRGDQVLATCRKLSPALREVSGVEVLEGVDVTDGDSLEKLQATLGSCSIDTLVVVAGIMRPADAGSLDEDGIREQFEVNALGPLRAVRRLQPSLKSPSKVALVTSRMGSLADNTSGGAYGYRMSKAALNMAGRSLAHDLKSEQVSVALLHPGWVKTDMTGGTGHIDAAESARGLLARIDEMSLETSGHFFHQNGEELPW